MEKSKSLIVWRTLLVLFIALVWGGRIGAYAAKMAWVECNRTNGTLTFKYGEKTTLSTGYISEYRLNGVSTNPEWASLNSNVTKVVFDPSFASALPTSCFAWFKDCQKLTTIIGIEYLNTSNVKNMAYMFYGCSGLTSLDVSKFNTSNVTNMAYMFFRCSGLTSLDVSNFNTSEVTIMGAMFAGCSGLTTLDVSSFNTSKVTIMQGMFTGCQKMETIFASDKFDVSNVTSSNGMFTYCTSLKGYDESKTDKAYATVNGGYFTNAYCPWVKYADGTLTFQYGYKKALGTDEYWLNEGSNTPGWNAKSSSIKTVVFDNTIAQARPTSCYRWFNKCSNLSAIKGIENLNTSNVTSMSYMFYRCSGLTSLDVSNFNTSNVADMQYMFDECSGLTSLDVSKFNTSNVTKMNSMFSQCSRLTSLDVSNFNTSKVTSMSYMFYRCSGLTSLDVSNFNTSNVTSMSSMFDNCSGLTSLDVSNFNTSNVTSMSSMFENCSALTSLDVSNFNTSKVTNMSSMFCNCSGLTSLDFSNFDTSKVTNMRFMFSDCSGLTSLDVSMFDTSKVTNMSHVFYNCSALTSLNLSKFDTKNATDMNKMFYGCSGFTSLDVSNFDTQNVTDMASMFSGCSKLSAIYWSDKFDADQLSSITNTDIFSECPATLYCSPKQYEHFKGSSVIASAGNTVKPYVSINRNMEYSTLCVPVGSSLAEGTFTGFDKLYQVTNADKDKGTITLLESKSIEPGVPYVYHRDLPKNAKSIITFEVDENASAPVSVPKNDGSLLKGTFESMIAPAGKYILQTDGSFHPVAADNTTLKVGAYHAYLDLSSLHEAYQMIFGGDETTGIDHINGDGSIHGQADQQPKVYIDLMGRKVSAPQKGRIYIVNGKKIVFNK